VDDDATGTEKVSNVFAQKERELGDCSTLNAEEKIPRVSGGFCNRAYYVLESRDLLLKSLQIDIDRGFQILPLAFFASVSSL
jgi:hypothetical protein